MTLEGYIEYQRREYCKDIKCPVQIDLENEEQGSPAYETIRSLCKTNCKHTTYEFHHWLINHGYVLLRPQTCAEPKK